MLIRRVVARLLIGFALVGAVDLTMAQENAQNPISVFCTGTSQVSVPTQEMLCAGLQTSLTAKYPNLQFTRSKTNATAASGSITLETFVANSVGIELRLIWQAADQNTVEGPRHGFSVMDKALTPDMHLKFLNRVVQDTALPF
jgi:hypothetical protein